ncbi:hypothetical protein ACJX0J_021018 [Zea mays]
MYIYTCFRINVLLTLEIPGLNFVDLVGRHLGGHERKVQRIKANNYYPEFLGGKKRAIMAVDKKYDDRLYGKIKFHKKYGSKFQRHEPYSVRYILNTLGLIWGLLSPGGGGNTTTARIEDMHAGII